MIRQWDQDSGLGTGWESTISSPVEVYTVRFSSLLKLITFSSSITKKWGGGWRMGSLYPSMVYLERSMSGCKDKIPFLMYQSIC